MNRSLSLAALAILAACNSKAPESNTDSTKSTEEHAAAPKPIQSPYDITYSSKFVMDEPKNAESVLAIWKAYDNADLSTTKDMFADSITAYWADGTMTHASRDSMLASAQAYRNSFKAAIDKVHAVLAVKSTDKDEHWALIWGTETDTYKNGKIDSTELQETWRFNKDGKADLVYQYKRPSAPPMKSK